ncbi:MAG: NADH-ubiquinone oxidoreductase-F iron-sulfur binding region domain-containing protein [Dehalococcoidales bacterium]|jgi:NADH:ubiquinone oxidoreductase subunit F (NADH-binding)|nr:NADH-ubiquinone oxidoreductase-F iron-sulfur binding region domain-containing protein [Dehalococcoidales bacterium]MDP7109445.1 NADH-ubiquinone oxidoreductase-F iron-sulfur binding region domain-containing protein [Dehalococcoidales bacterium]MDP7309843.1 NADH-ubiquinone oxidoreductase-F iron-sulfur binding region domain-containing protein [Dehalococcoidales bacterium]MDP7409751.1 NADH-ubiquinone oxidoreductase-F iron-sulfur binding region domain-containing protein [Dehalococcoidales bacteriu
MPEKQIVLKNCRMINPRDISAYLARHDFKALAKAQIMEPDEIISEVKASGLRGRGGAGFPCGSKWEAARNEPGDEKYLVGNADEGEVGTFKDRYIIENDPFTFIEGITIAAYAIGSKQSYIYLRSEYHRLRNLLENTISQAKDKGFLKHVKIDIREGAGAYICGEETALMDSIEGKRGEPRYRPPFPTTKGLWGKPTVINNVETLMNIPNIILNGAQQFSQTGTEQSKGTKVFSVSGDVAKPGVYELVLGSKLRELVIDLAGAETVKMVQIGGAMGRIVSSTMLDTPLSFETILGAGGVIVYNESRDTIDIVLRTMEFLNKESCGKCSPCREGTEAMVKILQKFAGGRGTPKDIGLLEELSSTMMLASLCGLGQAAPFPVIDSLQYFWHDYESRIK